MYSIYVCMSENLYPARLKQKVTVAPRSQTNRNVSSARLNRESEGTTQSQWAGEMNQEVDYRKKDV